MLNILAICEVFIEMGLIYSLIAMGYYITYTILDFPDLTVEGTFLAGAATYGVMVSRGINPWLGLAVSFVVGFLFGALTGVLNVKLKIRPLLCGILVSTLLITVNLILVTAGLYGDFSGSESPTVTLGRGATTLIKSFPIDLLPQNVGNIPLRKVVLAFAVAAFAKIMLDLFFKTKKGLLLRAAGDNASFVTTLSVDAGNSKILGLAIGNAYAAVSGALFATSNGNVNQGMGIGMVVIGLASLIIGLSLFRRVRFMKPTTKVIFGALIYQACLSLAIELGMPSAYNKLIMAILFTIALVLSGHGKAKPTAGGKK